MEQRVRACVYFGRTARCHQDPGCQLDGVPETRFQHPTTSPPQDGLCELNTFFLIARRQWKSQRTLFSAIYWASFFPMRIFLYPYMLVYFYRELTQPQYSRLSLVLCCGAQVVLILFNVVLLWLSVSNWWQRPARGGRRPAAPGAATATLSVGDGQSRAPKNAPTARKRISRAITSARDSMRVLR